ncbi:MAG: hypothetical protein LBD68_11120, partial [Zoogloeaceae bacterium]|nr:hypothetical protein [Zoogloeaceae bacterium]
KTIIGFNPAGTRPYPVAVMVEQHRVVTVDAHGFNAVTVQIQNQGIAGLQPDAGTEEVFINQRIYRMKEVRQKSAKCVVLVQGMIGLTNLYLARKKLMS